MTAGSVAREIAPAAALPGGAGGRRSPGRTASFWQQQILGWSMVSLLTLPLRQFVTPDDAAGALFVAAYRALGGMAVSGWMLQPRCLRWFEQPPPWPRLVVSVAGWLAVAATIETAAAAAINLSLNVGERTPAQLTLVFGVRFVLHAAWCGLFVGCLVVQRERGVRLAHAEEHARLDTLRGQLNPHFLFNSLTTLRGLIRTTPEAAIDVVSRLAVFYREALRRADHGEVIRLRDEVELVLAYLEIERVRLGRRLHVDVAVSPGLENHAVPPALLLPLVENAVKCSAAASPDTAQLSFRLYAPARDVLEIEVSHSGRRDGGCAGHAVAPIGAELADLRARLALHYPGSHEFGFSMDGDRVHARLRLRGRPRLATREA